jgi:uncharacterized protein (DUF2164 family)
MVGSSGDGPMRIKLSDEKRELLVLAMRQFFSSELELGLSEFQAQRLLDFLVLRLGAPVYNQAIQDARAFLHSKLDDLDGEYYEPDESD